MLERDVSARNRYAAWRENKQTMIWRKAPRCPYCRSIEFRKVGARGAMEESLTWLIYPFRCELCGHHFYLYPWQLPVEA